MKYSKNALLILRIVSGNFLEMFDFTLYGYYAAYIGEAFFPSSDPRVSLMMTFLAFGSGFLMRPLGAVFLGAYTDRMGRKKGLIRTLELMAIGVFLIAITPNYAAIGISASILILFSRLLQGLSAGSELGNTSVYLAEISSHTNRGFYVSWQSASQQVSVILASFLGVLLHQFLSNDVIKAWGWRIPFVIGCLILPLAFYLRSSMVESAVFLKQKKSLTVKEILISLVKSYRLILTAMFCVSLTNSAFYLITVYTPTFANKELHLSPSDSFIVTACVGLSNFILLPIMGALSDRLGRKKLLFTAPILFLLTSYPLMLWLASYPSFSRLITVELCFSLMYSIYNGALVVALTEIIPAHIRVSGFSVAYSLSTAFFGGFTPLICTKLIDYANKKFDVSHGWIANSMPGLWISFISILTLIALTILYWGMINQFKEETKASTSDPILKTIS